MFSLEMKQVQPLVDESFNAPNT